MLILSGTIATLEKMRNKVQEEECLAEAYGDISEVSLGVDEEIDKALAEPSAAKTSDNLAALKKKMGIES